MSLGNFLSSDKDLNYGTSSRGVSALTISRRLTLFRGATNTNGPKLKEVELTSDTVLRDLVRYVVPIDLEATAAGRKERTDTERVITDIMAIVRTVTLVPLVIGADTEIQVRARLMPQGSVDAEPLGAYKSTSRRSGVMVLDLRERIR